LVYQDKVRDLDPDADPPVQTEQTLDSYIHGRGQELLEHEDAELHVCVDLVDALLSESLLHTKSSDRYKAGEGIVYLRHDWALRIRPFSLDRHLCSEVDLTEEAAECADDEAGDDERGCREGDGNQTR
jgi:hypothetical protein